MSKNILKKNSKARDYAAAQKAARFSKGAKKRPCYQGRNLAGAESIQRMGCLQLETSLPAALG